MLLLLTFGCIDRVALSVEDGGAVLPCTVDPVPETVQTLRVGPTGEVWVNDTGGRLYRYDRTGYEDCSLDGELFYDPESLEGVTDFDLNGDGLPVALIHLAGIGQFAADGTWTEDCQTTGGHGIAVDPDGTRAWVIPVGATEIETVTLDGQTCTVGEPLVVERQQSTMPRSDGSVLINGVHDAGNDHFAGVVVNLGSGALEGDLGTTEEPAEGRWMASISDLDFDDEGYWVAGSPDGDLWAVNPDGSVRVRIHSDLTFPVPDDPDPTVSIQSLDVVADGPSYAAGGFLDMNQIWSLSL